MFTDIQFLFFPFVIIGIENLKFVKNFTAVNNFNLDFYPFTHSLLGTFFWAVLFYLLYFFGLKKNKLNKKNIAITMALAVLSHWFTDLIVHAPDLPIIHNKPKFGLGIWHSKTLTFFTEGILLLIALFYYLKKTTATTKASKFTNSFFVLFLLIVNYLNLFVLSTNDDIVSLTLSALLSYATFAGIAFYIDKKRI